MSDPKLDNIPRPSYWAFLLARGALGRGALHQSKTGDDRVTSYLTSERGKKSLMLINKYPATRAEVIISVPGFSGGAVIKLLDKQNADKGPSESRITLNEGVTITLPPHSLAVISIE